jgi:hypothetical protein
MNFDEVEKKEEDEIVYIFSESAEKAAAIKGLRVIYPKRNQLFIDIDSKEQLWLFQKRLHDIQMLDNKLFDDFKTTQTESVSGYPHFHIVLSLYKVEKMVQLDDWKRVALQFMLASDPVKETLTMFRILSGIENPSILFEKP